SKNQQIFADLALKLLLLGLALVLSILIVTLLVLLFICKRKQKRQKRRLENQTEEGKKQPNFGDNFKSESFIVVGQKLTKSSQQNGFSATFSQPKQQNLNKEIENSPKTPSPLNASEYLDLEEERRNGPKSIIRLENCGDNLKTTKQKRNPNNRKDSIRPSITNSSSFVNTNGPLKITVNDDSGYENSTLDPNDFKLINKESPLQMRRFQTNTMEKVLENENEKIYGEFECLGQQTMCTLRPRSTTAELPENIRKNLKLKWANNAYGGTNGCSDYINASYIKTEESKINLTIPKYIAAQGPIGQSEAVDGRRVETVKDFWEMIWQENINCIVMLTQLSEGVKQKCAQYWPECPGESEQFGNDFTVQFYCVTEDDICIKRELWLHRKGEKDRKEQLIDVKETVSRLRSQRISMVNNAEQYVALYEAIAFAIRKKSRSNG
uniref:Tyrosine-protein phosphatase domain-containing protein n=1 Tax=Meloidogyne javanica TaxID=6303 RepID=A0A915MI08_MELJA